MESDAEKNSNSDLSPNTSMINAENKITQQIILQIFFSSNSK